MSRPVAAAEAAIVVSELIASLRAEADFLLTGRMEEAAEAAGQKRARLERLLLIDLSHETAAAPIEAAARASLAARLRELRAAASRNAAVLEQVGRAVRCVLLHIGQAAAETGSLGTYAETGRSPAGRPSPTLLDRAV